MNVQPLKNKVALKEFKKEAVFRTAGQKEEGFNHVCKEDCYEIPIRKMKRPQDLAILEI